ncbi:MAG: glycosyltransferase, partial [Ignavibacteriaceae bacterium]|nr:glycosyltransferase [Ignavibacteriaceae bacterium]
VINDLAFHAKNDILIFTDANTVFDKNALKNLVKGYTSEKIGGVSGRLILNEPKDNFDKSSQEKKYWEYETIIKKAEGKFGVLIGANGGIFSIRKKLFKEIPRAKAVTDDFFVSLAVLSQGYKFVYQYDSFAFEEVARSVDDEFKRKVRFAATNFQTLFFFPDLLFNKNILLSISFWSHKVIRWFIPFLLILLFILSIWRSSYSDAVRVILYVQLFFYGASIVGKIGASFKLRLPFFSLAYFFVITNFALVLGFIRFLRGKHTVIWQSTPR